MELYPLNHPAFGSLGLLGTGVPCRETGSDRNGQTNGHSSLCPGDRLSIHPVRWHEASAWPMPRPETKAPTDIPLSWCSYTQPTSSEELLVCGGRQGMRWPTDTTTSETSALKSAPSTGTSWILYGWCCSWPSGSPWSWSTPKLPRG